MAVKLLNNQHYVLKTGETVYIHQQGNEFWYWKNFDSQDREIVTVTEDDIERHAYISRGGQEELEIGDIVVYLSGGYNSSPSMSIGQVTGFKNARVTVKFHDGQFRTSNLAPNNLMIITESKILANNKALKKNLIPKKKK